MMKLAEDRGSTRVQKRTPPPACWIVEVHLLWLKHSRTPAGWDPFAEGFVFWMLRIHERFDQRVIAWHATTVFPRTGTRARDALRIPLALHSYLPKGDLVKPAVSEIVLIFNAVSWRGEQLDDRHLPPWQDLWEVRQRFLRHDTDQDWYSLRRIAHPKLMKMVILPTHRVLNCDMQGPKRVSGWNSNFSPYERQDSDELDLQPQ
jgi:hypothetical protein